jgi:hypothetical protein
MNEELFARPTMRMCADKEVAAQEAGWQTGQSPEKKQQASKPQ